jgi:transcriptional regulator of acetoin/glycerol metabolism
MKSRGEVAEAIRISGLSRTRLYDFLQKHNLSLSMGTPIE